MMLKADAAFKNVDRGFLPMLAAFMVFLACLTLATALTGNSVATDWEGRTSGSLTIQLMPDLKAKNPEKEMEERIKAVSALLKRTPGVRSIRAIGLDETRELLRPWLGDMGGGRLDVPLPRIITLEASDVIPLGVDELKKEIGEYSALVAVETYEGWIGEFRKTVGAVQTLLGLIIVMMLATTAMAIAYATRSGLAANRKVVEIMHMVGARNSYISRQFSHQMALLSLTGAMSGYAASVAAIIAIRQFAGRIEDGIISDFALPPYVYLYMLAVPLAAVAIAKVTAMLTVTRALGKMV
ncbi:MAG: hypothetical protein LBI17_03245 [Rickettsiales bacterium]|jgi:cell division transport system permease protein|nr:hypothetical protein [Rickettsiales bacterium]